MEFYFTPANDFNGDYEDQYDQTVTMLARTIWGESRGESEDGQIAVGNVILNRVYVSMKQPNYWWGSTIIEVCQKPFQFSCWNPNDPNRKKILSVDERTTSFHECLLIAQNLMDGLYDDNTNGATHYHADYVHPSWAEGQTPTAEIGRHIFYRVL